MTTQHEIGVAIDAHNDKLSRIERLTATMGGTEKERLALIKQQVALGLARTQGSNLTQQISDAMLAEIVLRPEIIAAITIGTDAELPKDQVGWDRYAKSLVAENPIAQRCILSKTEQISTSIKQEELSKLKPAQRVAMSRNGNELDEYLDACVSKRLEQLAGM